VHADAHHEPALGESSDHLSHLEREWRIVGASPDGVPMSRQHAWLGWNGLVGAGHALPAGSFRGDIMAWWFGRKKKLGELASPAAVSEVDSPVESVSLRPVDKIAPASGADEAARAHSYGIDQAVALMRLLPSDSNVELLVLVVKKTLESTNISVAKIIDDATRKQKDIEGHVSTLERAISELQKAVQERASEIGRLRSDLEETSRVKGRLELAERLSSMGHPHS
jgi:hypothetical protein